MPLRPGVTADDPDGQVTLLHEPGRYCPLGVLIADVGRYSPAAQAVTAQLIRRWQECVRAGIEATQASGETGSW